MSTDPLIQASGSESVQVVLGWADLDLAFPMLKINQALVPDNLQDIIVNEILPFLLNQHALTLWKAPELTEISISEAGLEFKAHLALLPRVRLPEDYRHLSLKVPPVPLPTEEDLLQTVLDLQRELGHETEVTRPIEMGDKLTLDLVVTLGDRIVPLSARADFEVVLEEGLFFEGFAEGLIGHLPEETLEIPSRLPLDYDYPAWRGREVIYNVFIKKVWALDLPPLDNRFAALCGKGTNHDEMMEQLYAELLEANQRHWRNAVGQLLLAELVPRCDIESPDALIEAEMQASWERLGVPALIAQGIDDESIALAKETWMKFGRLREQCFWTVVTTLVLRAICLQEKITLEPADWQPKLKALDELLDEMSDELGFERPNARSNLPDDPQLLDRLMLDKTLGWLISQAELIFEADGFSKPSRAAPAI